MMLGTCNNLTSTVMIFIFFKAMFPNNFAIRSLLLGDVLSN
jgi:hypothetical protein